MAELYIRKFGLVVSSGQNGLDLSNLRCVFHVTQADVDSPNTLIATIFNPTRETADQIQKEFEHVVLQAGYEQGNFAVIFEGTIKQVMRGRLNATDTFVRIFAADGDEAYNFAVVNKTLAAGANLRQQVDAVAASFAEHNVSTGNIPNELGTGGTLPRGKVLFGMARERMTDLADSGKCSWSIQNGKLILIEETGYLPDEAVVISARTGMVGVPETTNNGVEVRVLLNPLLKIGTRLQIDNASINQLQVRQQGFPRYTDLNFPANTSADGMYRALVIEHEGDSRGEPWYSTVTALAVDPSSAPGNSVLPDG